MFVGTPQINTVFAPLAVGGVVAPPGGGIATQERVNLGIRAILGVGLDAGGFPAYPNIGSALGADANVVFAAIDGVLAGGGVTINDTLSSTSTTEALSPNMGRLIGDILGNDRDASGTTQVGQSENGNMGPFVLGNGFMNDSASVKQALVDLVAVRVSGPVDATANGLSLIGPATNGQVNGRPQLRKVIAGTNTTVAYDVNGDLQVNVTADKGRFRGTFAAANAYPVAADGQNHVNDPIQSGDYWLRTGADATVAADSGGETTITSKDEVIALVDAAGTTGTNWAILKNTANSADLNIVNNSVAAAVANQTRTQDFNNGNQVWNNLGDLTINANTLGNGSTDATRHIASDATGKIKLRQTYGNGGFQNNANVRLLTINSTTHELETLDKSTIGGNQTLSANVWQFVPTVTVAAGANIPPTSFTGIKGTAGTIPGATLATVLTDPLIIADAGGSAHNSITAASAAGITLSYSLIAGVPVEIRQLTLA